MSGRVGLIFVVLLAVGLACDARDLTATSSNKLSMVSVLRSSAEKRFKVLGNTGKNDNLCSLCEEYASEALMYLKQNKTQHEIISILHESCSKLKSLTKQCITLVDYYAPLFFLELSTIQPAEFCGKVNLCSGVVAYAQKFSQNSCDTCNMAVSEVIKLLKDPDNQLTILQLLLKECKNVEQYLPKCKVLVFEYAPLILTNAEQFLEKEDLCTKLHVCDPHASSVEEASLVSDN
uniref:prosaposin-like n=1 Tax=Erigeron canadensis TaxID=72917 RepID=UPI001CB928E9|nr:prosaposin-like [Erigeron canadensis]